MLSKVRLAGITDAPLSVDKLIAAVATPEVGGIGIFLGVVRSRDEGRAVDSLDYSDHPSADAVLAECAGRVAAQHDVIGVAVEHRVGHLEVGELAVVVVVGAVVVVIGPVRLHTVDRRDQKLGSDLEGAALQLRCERLGRTAVIRRLATFASYP